MAALPPRRNPTPTRMSRQNQTPLQILLQMGFPKHRAEKALACTGYRSVQLASDWLLAHVTDPALDDMLPREYILYACPTGEFLARLRLFWLRSSDVCGWNGAHNFTPHITLVSFFKVPDENVSHIVHSLRAVMERNGAILNESLKLEKYVSPNFMGLFVAEEHVDYLKRIALQYYNEISRYVVNDTYEQFDALTACFPWCTTTTARCIPRGSRSISLEPHNHKSLHLTLAYQFPNAEYENLKAMVEDLDPNIPSNWELRLYSRDQRITGKQVYKVVRSYTPIQSDELELRVNDYVYVTPESVSNSPDGWVEGTSWVTGSTGQLPLSYTERTAESDAWTLHKKISINTITPNSDSNSSVEMLPLATNEPSVLNNEEVNIPIPPEMQEMMVSRDNVYENLIDCQTRQKREALLASRLQQGTSLNRSLYIMRHGERIDFTFGSWVPYCFDGLGFYSRKDLNMPKSLPDRIGGATAYLKDSPLTNVGLLEARLVGEALREENVMISHVYCSPSFRCVQTCDAVLAGLNRKEVAIKIEPGLFEWMAWYPPESIPQWMTPLELIQAGYNIDENYIPFLSEKEILESRENCERFYFRSAYVAKSALASHLNGNILFVGHTATLETCSRELLNKRIRSSGEMTKIIQKIPYCSLIELKENQDEWSLVEPPCMPLTHSANHRFDWKVLL